MPKHVVVSKNKRGKIVHGACVEHTVRVSSTRCVCQRTQTYKYAARPLETQAAPFWGAEAVTSRPEGTRHEAGSDARAACVAFASASRRAGIAPPVIFSLLLGELARAHHTVSIPGYPPEGLPHCGLSLLAPCSLLRSRLLVTGHEG